MLYLCISCESCISIVATLIGVCAVFVTVSPIVYDARYKTLKKDLDILQKKIDDLENKLSSEIKQHERENKLLEDAFKNGELERFVKEKN